MGVAKPIDNDDVIVNKIVTELSKKNYSSQELILQIINSRPFLNRSKTRWEKGIEDRAQGLTTRPLLQQILRPKFPQRHPQAPPQKRKLLAVATANDDLMLIAVRLVVSWGLWHGESLRALLDEEPEELTG